ncbi:MAG: hypothetical protein PHR92_06020 [Lachnospiraceae bacterium]|nr:hypothetical protein [Lachnospiraceae bacterium]
MKLQKTSRRGGRGGSEHMEPMKKKMATERQARQASRVTARAATVSQVSQDTAALMVSRSREDTASRREDRWVQEITDRHIIISRGRIVMASRLTASRHTMEARASRRQEEI